MSRGAPMEQNPPQPEADACGFHFLSRKNGDLHWLLDEHCRAGETIPELPHKKIVHPQNKKRGLHQWF